MMNALQFAQEFINDLPETITKFNDKNNISFIFNKSVLSDDPNLEILNKELEKLNYKLVKQDNTDNWVLVKI